MQQVYRVDSYPASAQCFAIINRAEYTVAPSPYGSVRAGSYYIRDLGAPMTSRPFMMLSSTSDSTNTLADVAPCVVMESLIYVLHRTRNVPQHERLRPRLMNVNLDVGRVALVFKTVTDDCMGVVLISLMTSAGRIADAWLL